MGLPMAAAATGIRVSAGLDRRGIPDRDWEGKRRRGERVVGFVWALAGSSRFVP